MLKFPCYALFLLFSPLLLSSCYLGDKFSEEVSCPRNAVSGNFEIPFKGPSALKIPKKYVVECNTRYPVPEGKPIESVSFAFSYPDFQPVKSHIKDIKAGDIFVVLHLNQSLNGAPTISDADSFATLVSNNKKYMDGNRHQFAPIKLLENDVYYQKNIRVPHLDGNASILYYYDENQQIGGLFYCDSLNKCSANHNDPAYRYSFRYIFKDMPTRDFPTIDRNVKQFVEKLFLQKYATD